MGDEVIKNSEEDDVIEFEPGLHFVRAHNYIPYSHWRVKRILKEHFGCHMEKINGYKYNRTHPETLYRVIFTETGETLFEKVTLHQLRKFLAQKDFPQFDDKCTYPFPVQTKKEE